MKHVYNLPEERIGVLKLFFLQLLSQLEMSESALDFIRTLFTYLASTSEAPYETVKETLINSTNKKSEDIIMTMKQLWEREAEKKGKIEGKLRSLKYVI